MPLLIINTFTFLVILAYASSLDIFHESIATKTSLPTVTVRGFLNFRTTVDGTVIVFTPASASSESQPTVSVVHSSSIESTKNSAQIKPTSSSEYSKTPPTSALSLETKPQYPTGLVTILGGTVVLNGATTVYETKVIGTYINGKYAQILKSTSHVKEDVTSSITSAMASIQPSKPISVSQAPKPTPHVNLFSSQITQLDSPKPELFTSKLIIGDNNNKNSFLTTRRKDSNSPKSEDPLTKLKLLRFNNNNNSNNNNNNNNNNSNNNSNNSNNNNNNSNNNNKKKEEEESENQKIKISRASRLGSKRLTYTPRQTPRVRLNRFKVKVPTARDKVEEEAAKEINQRFQKRLGTHKSPIPQSLKPREEAKEDHEDERPVNFASEHTHEGTIEPQGVIKQVQTVTSEITQHLNGNQIKVDSITFTTILKDVLHPSAKLLNDEIIAPTIPSDGNDLDVVSVQETPPIVISRTYSMTDRISRTTVIPVFDGSMTTNHTVTESFVIRKLITAYKTMPPGDFLLLQTAAFDINNSTFLIDNFESTDSNIEPSIFHGNIELTGSSDENLIQKTSTTLVPIETFEPTLGLPSSSPLLPNIDLNNPLIFSAALRNPALAAMYLGLQNLQNQQPSQQYETVIKPTELVTTETVYNTKTISFYDGRATRTRTITEPGTTTEKTITTYTTEMTPILNSQLLLQQAQLQRIFATQLLNPVGLNLNQATLNPALAQLAPFNPQPTVITNIYTTVTSVTSTSTKVYTLKYNAFSTKYRTVTSTSIYPTVVTTVSTSTIANTLPPGFNPFFG